MLSAVILASGDSKRMGRPKALLKWQRKFFIEHICDNLHLAGVKERIVVLGKDSKIIMSAWNTHREKIAINPNPSMGQISSLRVGLEAVDKRSQGYMVCLVDMPLVKPKTYKQIIDFWASHKDSIVIPVFRISISNSKLKTQNLKLKRGHPIIIPAIYRHLCFEGPVDKGLHWVIHHENVRVLDLQVNDENILRDVDTYGDYKQLNSRIKSV